MGVNVRRQLTLFLDKISSENIEGIRKKYDPIQFNLIKAHVTLCREDELENMSQIRDNLRSIYLGSVTINFDNICRFSDQKGLMISAHRDNLQYHHLRKLILKDLFDEIKIPEPHITLMHPRNSLCTDEIFTEITKIKIPTSLNFNEISLIEQVDDGAWKLIETFSI